MCCSHLFPQRKPSSCNPAVHVQNPALPLNRWAALGKLLNFSVSQPFVHKIQYLITYLLRDSNTCSRDSYKPHSFQCADCSGRDLTCIINFDLHLMPGVDTLLAHFTDKELRPIRKVAAKFGTWTSVVQKATVVPMVL